MSTLLLAASSPVVGSFIACATLRLCEGRSWAEACRPSPLYAVVEVAAVLVAAIPLLLLEGWRASAGCGLGWTLLLLAMIDLRRRMLPDLLTLPLLAAGLLLALSYDPDQLAERALAAALGWLGFALLSARSRRRGCQAGEPGQARLAAAAGAWVGLSGLALAVLAAAAAQSAIGWAAHRRPPFGPFLAASLFGVWMCLS